MNIVNKKAKFNYNLFDKFEAGVSLLGAEVKALRTKGASLADSYVKILEGEPYLINVNIPVEGKKDYSPTRMRKLLLHKKEVISLESQIKAKKLTLVPIRLYTKGPLIKAEIALAKSKKSFEKKESLKKKDIERDIARELRGQKQ